jgi:hypothetical protein
VAAGRAGEAEAALAEADCPALVSPREGAVLDNGRTDGTDPLVWQFKWSGCTGATVYQIYVRHRGASQALVSRRVTKPTYQYRCDCYVAEQNRHNWYWRVRAKVGGSWKAWSPERPFDVQSPDTDPPS